METPDARGGLGVSCAPSPRTLTSPLPSPLPSDGSGEGTASERELFYKSLPTSAKFRGSMRRFFGEFSSWPSPPVGEKEWLATPCEQTASSRPSPPVEEKAAAGRLKRKTALFNPFYKAQSIFKNAPGMVLIFPIRIYRWTISPALSLLFGPYGGCRFTPTCSQYAMDAIREHGALAGLALSAKRICRCHPWGGCGHDPVPGKTEHARPGIEGRIVLKNAG